MALQSLPRCAAPLCYSFASFVFLPLFGGRPESHQVHLVPQAGCCGNTHGYLEIRVQVSPRPCPLCNPLSYPVISRHILSLMRSALASRIQSGQPATTYVAPGAAGACRPSPPVALPLHRSQQTMPWPCLAIPCPCSPPPPRPNLAHWFWHPPRRVYCPTAHSLARSRTCLPTHRQPCLFGLVIPVPCTPSRGALMRLYW